MRADSLIFAWLAVEVLNYRSVEFM